MKNKIIRNTLLTVVLSSVIAVPTYAQNIKAAPISANSMEIIPISLRFNHWSDIFTDIYAKNLSALIKFSLNKDSNKSDYELNEEGIIKSDYAKKTIKETADTIINLIKNKDAEKLAGYVHPEKGIRFTPYTTVSVENDVVINKEAMKNFFNDNNLYLWGYYDGRGDEIKLTPGDYYNRFIYTEDFSNAPEIGYNEVLGGGNMIENQFDVYKNSIVVEYYIPEINPEYEGLDWQSLRLVFEEYEGNWVLVGIIHNQWTI